MNGVQWVNGKQIARYFEIRRKKSPLQELKGG